MVAAISTPMRRTRSLCCALDASGHVGRSAKKTDKFPPPHTHPQDQAIAIERLTGLSPSEKAKQPTCTPNGNDDCLHNRREIDRERNRNEKNGIDRTRCTQRLRETNSDEFGSHEQNETVRRRNQSERKCRNQDNTHVNGVDISCLGQRVHQWHEND